MIAARIIQTLQERRVDLVAAAAYFFAALLFFLPLPVHWATFIPGDNGDSYPNLWPFWYYPHALMSGGGLFYHKLLFSPEGLHLVFTSASPVGAILMAPISLLISPAAGLNCWLLLHLWLGGYFLYRFCRHLDCGPWAAWIGGLTFAWSPFVAVHLTGHYTLTQVGFTAAALLSLAVLVKRAGGRETAEDEGGVSGWRVLFFPAAVLALSCWAVAITDFYLATMTLFLLLAALAHFALNGETRLGLRSKSFWGSITCAAAVTMVLLVPWMVAIIQARDGHDYSALDPSMGSKNIASWNRLITLPAYHGLWEPLFFPNFMGKISLFNEWTYLGMVAFFIAGVGMLYVRPLRRGAAWIFAFVLFLGLGAGNRYSVELGYASGALTFGRWWPDFFPFSQFRVPGRWQFALCTALAIGLAISVDALLYRRSSIPGVVPFRSKRAVLALLITAAIGFDQMRWPLPVCEARPVDAGIPTMGDAVLDIPVGIRSGQGHSLGQFDTGTLLRQMIHGRPVLSANVSRLPDDVMKRLKSDAELTAFFIIQNGTSTAAADAVTSAALDWPAFQQRYNFSTARVPLDWPTSASLRQMIDQTAPGEWNWREHDNALIGELN